MQNNIIVDISISNSIERGNKFGTAADREAMGRMGKRQQLKRNHGFSSIFGFALILMSSWQTLLGSIAFGLGNGGPSGLLYTYIVSYTCSMAVVASLAEMASMAPTSAGQYHWVSEFAPPHIQKHISYLVGWLSLLGFQIGVTITSFVSSILVQGLIVLNNPDTYVPERWHAPLIAICITSCVASLNIFFAHHLPLIDGIILVLHFAGWIAIVVVLWVLGPRTADTGVWNSYMDAGWGNAGVACMIGVITSIGALCGGDAAAHMAEETKDASKVLPQVMMCTIVVNGAMGLIMLITFLYTMGDINAALETSTGFPIIEVFRNATGSSFGATVLTSILVATTIAAHLAAITSASRQLFAFARDKGVPQHQWISTVSPQFNVPVNAVITTSTTACILYFINIGSIAAFNIITSVGLVSLVASYIASISCIAWRRIKGLPLLDSDFRLGRTGLPVNLVSLVFLLIVFVMLFFPATPDPPPTAMNWAFSLYGGVLVFAFCYYFVLGRRHYAGPVEYVRRSV